MGEWHYVVDGAPVGPVTWEDIENRFREGVIDRDTLVWSDGMSKWLPMHEVEAFKGLTRKSSPPPLPGSAATAPVVKPESVPEPDAKDASDTEKEQIKLSNLRMSEPRIPWTRYFARTFDVSVLGTVLLTIAFIGSSYMSPKLYLSIYVADPRALLFFMLPVVMVFNGIIIAVFGNSPGKKLFGIRAVNVQADRSFTLTENIARELRVWMRGLALGIPFVNFFTMIPAFRRVKDGKPTAYDEGIASVRPYSDNPVRRTAGMIVTIMILVGIVASNAVDKRNLERVSRPYSWTNPMTNIATRIPGGWESETMQGPDGVLYSFTNLKTGVVVFLAVETSNDHTLVSYANALETSLSRTMTFNDWTRYDLPEVWKRTGTMKDGNHPAALLLTRLGTSFWRVVYVDQIGATGSRDVEKRDLTRALFASIGIR